MLRYGENYSDNAAFQRDVDAKIKRYADSDKALAVDQAISELVAQETRHTLFADEESVQRLVQRDPGLAQRMLQALNRVLDKLRGMLADDSAVQVERARTLLEVALNDRAEQARQDERAELPAGAQYSLNLDFEKEFDAWDRKNPRTSFVIGRTSDALKSIGVQEQDILWDAPKILKVLRKHTAITDAVIKQVPQILENPIIMMQTQSQTFPSRITMFGEVSDSSGVPVLAVLELLPKGHASYLDGIQIIASVYGKDNALQSFVDTSNILYIDPDKTRTRNWLARTGVQFPVGVTASGPIGRISYEGEGVNANTKFLYSLTDNPGLHF